MRNVKRIGSFAIVLLSFLLIVYGVYNLSLSNKSRMFNYLKSTYTVNSEILKDLNRTKITYEGTLVNDNKTGNITGELYLDSIYKMYLKVLLETNGMGVNYEYLKDSESVYIKLKDISDHYIRFKDSAKKYSKTNEFSYFLSVLREAVFKSVKESNFDRNNQNITVYDDDFEVTKYSMIITNTDLINVFNYIDKKAGDSFLLNAFVSNFKDLIDDYSLLEKNTKLFTYSIFVKDDKIVRHVLSIPAENDEGVKSSLDIELSSYKYDTKNNLDYYGLRVIAFDNVIYEVNIIKQDELHYEISGESYDERQQFNGIITDDYIDFTMKYDGEERIVISVVKNVLEENQKYELQINASFDQKTSLSFNVVVEKNSVFPEIDLSEAIDYSQLGKKELKKTNIILELFKDIK